MDDVPAPGRAGGEAWTAEAVAALRRRRGLSQAGMARLLGVRQQTISEWETGLHRPRGASARLLRLLAEERAPYDAGQAEPRRPGGGG
jgi:DNA-binding transcriptional regulator YiaG